MSNRQPRERPRRGAGSTRGGTRLAVYDGRDMMPTRSSRMAIAKSLREMAGLLALAGESPFRARAYERAATAIERLDVDLAALVEAGRLTELPGIGRGIAATIAELQRTGRSRALDALRGGMPPGALSLGRIPGLSLDKIRALHAALGVETVAELQAACEDGRVRGVKGLGEKTERRLLERILALEAPPANVRLHLDRALALAEAFAAHVRSGPGVLRAEIAGALRRRVETVDRLVFVAAARAPEPVIGHALASPLVASVSRREAERCAAVLGEGVPLELAVVKPDRYPGALLDATGSPGHLRDLGRVAHDRGLVLDTTGLTSKASGTRVPAAGEDDLYRRLGLPPDAAGAARGQRRGRGGRGRDPAGRPRHRRRPAGPRPLPHGLLRRQAQRRGDGAGGGAHGHAVHHDHRPLAHRLLRARPRRRPAARAVGRDRAGAGNGVGPPLARARSPTSWPTARLDYPDAILEQLDVVIASIHARHRMDADRDDPPARPRHAAPVLQDLGPRAWAGSCCRGRPSSAGSRRCSTPRRRAAPPSRSTAIRTGSTSRRAGSARRASAGSASSSRPTRIPSTRSATSAMGVAMARRGWVRRGEVLNTLDADAFVRAVAPARPRVSRDLPALAGPLRGRARAAALRQPRAVRPRPAPAPGPAPRSARCSRSSAASTSAASSPTRARSPRPPPGLPGILVITTTRRAVPRGRARGPRRGSGASRRVDIAAGRGALRGAAPARRAPARRIASRPATR